MYYRTKLENEIKGADSKVLSEYSSLIESLCPVEIIEIPYSEIKRYKFLYDKENLKIDKNPFINSTKYSRCFIAKVRGKLAGITCFDVLKDGNQIYQHSALTIERFRNTGINTALWNYKIRKIKKFSSDNCELLTINPSWIPGAEIMKNRLLKIGFNIIDYRPDSSPVLSCKLGDLKGEY
jgi:hypothetical protein